jgi:LmbE family N-acetylglucosaminyl deacetylase
MLLDLLRMAISQRNFDLHSKFGYVRTHTQVTDDQIENIKFIRLQLIEWIQVIMLKEFNSVTQANADRILVLAPHTDDAELGCGGTIARFVEEGAEIFVVAFSTAEESLPEDIPKDTLRNEFFAAMPILGVPSTNLLAFRYPVRKLSAYRQEILEELVRLNREFSPNLVLLPSGQDVHQDHNSLYIEGVRAFKATASILGYELPWNHMSFTTQAFVVLESRHIMLKWKALQEYKSQIKLKRRYFSSEFIESIARVRGTQINTEWAESFEVVRLKWN